MEDQRQKDKSWIVADANGKLYGAEFGFQPQMLATMMDIRDELKALNAHLRCYNFVRIPKILDRISANTYKPKKKRKKVVA